MKAYIRWNEENRLYCELILISITIFLYFLYFSKIYLFIFIFMKNNEKAWIKEMDWTICNNKQNIKMIKQIKLRIGL